MIIVAISVVQDEKLVIEDTIRHLLAHGIHKILIVDHRSTDGTTEILSQLANESGKIDIERKEDKFFRQDKWVNELICKAGEMKAKWILPFDADEIFIPLTKRTLAEELNSIGGGALACNSVSHASIEKRSLHYAQWGKRVFSYHYGVSVDFGNHNVGGHKGLIHNRVELRHREYVSAEHFITKTRKHLASRPPEMSPQTCCHFWVRRMLSDRELTAQYVEWAKAHSVVTDPIPLRRWEK